VIVVDQLAISPEPFIKKCRNLAKAKSPYIEVMDGRARLAWSDYGGETELMDRVEMNRLGISYEMLLDALSEAGGANSMSGRYPTNNTIRQRLTKLFETK
jgi:hypothetical protein